MILVSRHLHNTFLLVSGKLIDGSINIGVLSFVSGKNNITTTTFLPPTTKATVDNSIVVCEYGLDSCGEHQECYLPKNSLKRSGICVCVEGYVMGTDNQCILNASTTPVSTHATVHVYVHCKHGS